MSRWIVDIQKRHVSTLQSWGNRYIVEAGNIAVAVDCGHELVSMEQAFHFDVVEFTNLRVSSQVEFDSVFASFPQGGHGGQISGGLTLPMFLAVEVKLLTSGSVGRHGLKFYHVGLDVTNYDANFKIDGLYAAAISGAVDDGIAAVDTAGGSIVSPDGSAVYTTPSVELLVKSHQFTKASKRTPPL